MKKLALVAIAMVLVVSMFAGTAQAVIGYGTRNITIKKVVSPNCINALDPEDDPALCDVRAAGNITIRNRGTKELIVTCPINVWKTAVLGDPIASTEVHFRIKPGRVQTIRWVATGHDTISDVDWFATFNKLWEFTALRRSELRTADPVQVVSCI